MNETQSEPTVGEMAARQPGTTRIFERFGIDYCCHGRHTLEAACASAGVEPSTVRGALAELAAQPAPPAVDWTAQPLDALVDHLLAKHHAFTRDELARIAALGAKVVNAHGAKHPEVAPLRELARELEADLLPHLMKEERVLFPYVRSLAAGEPAQAPFGSVAMPVRMMDREHEAVGVILAALRERTGGYAAPADACPTWRAWYDALHALEQDLHQHIHLESNVIFPRALEAERAVFGTG